MTAPLYLGPEPEERHARELLETLLVDDETIWRRFERACLAGVVRLRDEVLDFRRVLLEAGHVFDSHGEQFEEVCFVLLQLAEDLLPDSPAAVRAGLRERVRESVAPRPDGGVRMVGAVGVRRAVEVVAAYEDAMFDEVVVSCSSHERLYRVAARIRAGLATTGRRYPTGDVEDALLMLVREIAPSSLAAKPDSERMFETWRQAQNFVDARPGSLDEDERQRHEVAARHAAREHDLPAYRAALRELCWATNRTQDGGTDV